MTPITSTSSTGQTQTAAAQSAQTTPLLGKDAFLMLMMTQLQNQDPLNPSQDPTQYISELAQFTSLEQETNIAQSSLQAAGETTASTSLALLGHTVTYTDQTTGTSVTGIVQKVDFSSSGPTLTVAGVSGIDPATVSEVS
jgi:flagellar basal-body rod modification protein FlgD